ncbi:uncharacterized protein NPIL_255161 [Nephila pilipes]|uniref:Transcription factor Adf-1 n=1 Tax=Nephila pilipes TaxID=299642 RepID=A0A8X6UH36_NEPPI|nr:uncharacterized protein NPIL_255161 [Nephila pilipes]
MDSELIILEVQKHPCLYDPKSAEYKNREVKKNAWKSVSKMVAGDKWAEMDNESKTDMSRDIQKRWKSMKDSYVKSKKTEEINWSGKRRRPYVYHKLMSFLEFKDGTENMIVGHQTDSSDDEEEVSCEEAPVPPSVEQSSRLSRKRKQDAGCSITPKPDPDEMFFLSQIPLIKKMTPLQKLDLQVKFLQLLQYYNESNTS